MQGCGLSLHEKYLHLNPSKTWTGLAEYEPGPSDSANQPLWDLDACHEDHELLDVVLDMHGLSEDEQEKLLSDHYTAAAVLHQPSMPIHPPSCILLHNWKAVTWLAIYSDGSESITIKRIFPPSLCLAALGTNIPWDSLLVPLHNEVRTVQIIYPWEKGSLPQPQPVKHFSGGNLHHLAWNEGPPERLRVDWRGCLSLSHSTQYYY